MRKLDEDGCFHAFAGMLAMSYKTILWSLDFVKVGSLRPSKC